MGLIEKRKEELAKKGKEKEEKDKEMVELFARLLSKASTLKDEDVESPKEKDVAYFDASSGNQ